jgi:anti-sigma factor RsiW
MSDPELGPELLQEYIDGRLSPREEARVAAHLLANPKLAAEVERHRQIASALEGVGAEVLDEEIPERLRRVVRDARRGKAHAAAKLQPEQLRGLPHSWYAGLLAGAAMILGLIGGWFLRDLQLEPVNPDQLAIEQARSSFRLYAARETNFVEFPADRQDGLAAWIKDRFQREIPPPDLGEVGLRFLGGRMLSWTNRQSGFYLYENADGTRVAITFWPRPGERPAPLHYRPTQDDDTLAARFLAADGLGFAVLSRQPAATLDPIVKRISTIYAKRRE